MLSNKRAVITGGSDSIGFGIAKEFARNGAHVFLSPETKKSSGQQQ